MNQFNQNVATVLSRLREANYTGRNIRMYELFYKKLGVYLIQIGEKYSPSSGSVYIQNIQKSKHQQLYFEKSAVAILNDVYNTGEIKGIHLSITGLGRTVLLTSQCLEQVDEYLKKVSSVYSNSQLYNIKRRILTVSHIRGLSGFNYLPEWCRIPLDAFANERRREKLDEDTVHNYIYSCKLLQLSCFKWYREFY